MKKIRKISCIVLLAAGLLMTFTACGQKALPLYRADSKKVENLNLPIAEKEDKTLYSGMNRFAHHFYDAMKSTENVFFSPYSISVAISLLNMGAEGETKAEIEEMLGITDFDSWNQQLKLYLEKEWGEHTKLLTANSLWIAPYMNQSAGIEKDFLQPAAFYYKTEAFEANFAEKGPEVVKAMNEWVDKNTKGMIPQYKKEVDPESIMVILNAVYFEGKWETPFETEDTLEEGTFTNSKGEVQEKIPMMRQYGSEYRYVETGEWKGLEIPYKDSSVVMDILIPAEEDFNGIEKYQKLTLEERQTLWQSFEGAGYVPVNLFSLPRFTMDLTVEKMKEILQDMGMSKAFLEEADFGRIGEDLFVSDVLHRAKIEVDEEGTKAAAVTEIVMEETSMKIEEKIVDFVVNRPFLYLIRDVDSGMILFMGQTTDF